MSKVLVDRDWLKRTHRDLDACQKLIWANIRGADPAYCSDAQDRLKEIDEMLALSQQAGPDHIEDMRAMVEPAPAQDEREVAAVIGFYEGEREPRLLSWNVLPNGEHRLYTRPAQTEQQPLFFINPLVIDELKGKRKPSPGGLTWSRTACGHWTFAVYAAPIAQTAPQPEQSERWQSVTRPGQIDVGDWLSFTVGGCLICAKARDVLNPGTDREEVIYNRAKNYYFITRMAVDGSSSHKGVMRAAPCAHVGDT